MQLKKLGCICGIPVLGQKNETNHLFFYLKWHLKSKLHGNPLSNESFVAGPKIHILIALLCGMLNRRV